MAGWRRRVENLGHALLDLLQAEIDALLSDLGRALRRYRNSLLLMALAGVLAVMLVAVTTFTFILVLALWMKPWQAAALTALLLLVAVGVLLWVALRIWKRTENPAQAVQRRVGDHLDWWRNRLLDEDALPAAEDDDQDEEHDEENEP